MNVTALTVCNRPYSRRYAGLEAVTLPGREICCAADAQAAWFDAVELVRTPYFFFLDDDDELPANHLDVIWRCVAQGADLAYTDERVVDAGGRAEVRRGAPYLQSLHVRHPLLVHHLAVCRTEAARAAIARLPRGHYWPEMMLFWELAKTGAAYVPEVGYVWHRSAAGLHTKWWTTVAMVQTQLYCRQHP